MILFFNISILMFEKRAVIEFKQMVYPCLEKDSSVPDWSTDVTFPGVFKGCTVFMDLKKSPKLKKNFHWNSHFRERSTVDQLLLHFQSSSFI